ncbi:GNAT family N-acetyltransferase [bacterium]|nr:GNAT family N-acetyltransferase [bacterium]
MNNEETTLCNQVEHNSEGYRKTVALRDEILRRPLNLSFSAEELNAEDGSFHLACWRDGILAACLVLKPLSENQICMRQLAVQADLQRRGIGRKLVNYAESFAKQHGYHEMVLHARETAVEFYEKLGYRKEGDRFTEVTLPHYRMRKILGNRKTKEQFN